MLTDALSSSSLLLALSTVGLFAIGRQRLGWRIWRVALLLGFGLATATLTGQLHAWSPAIDVTGLAIAVALAAPRSWWAAGAAAFAALVVATVVYLAYLVDATVSLVDSPASALLGAVLLAVEFFALGLMTAAVFEVVDSLCRPLTIPRPPDPPAAWPTVCLQVPAHQEPPELVIETLRSLVAIDYPQESLVIQVIDNNTDDPALWQPVQAECQRLEAEGSRVMFVHLADWPGYKSGALNWGREHLPADVAVVGVIDADYVVEPEYLRSTIPYFADPSVSFVQTPQEYRGWSGSAFYRACHTGFAYFFRVGMVSRAYRNSIIFAGTMGLIRRNDLDAIGGWDEAIITEDAEASLRILARGGHGIYLPMPFGRGIMPLTYEALRSQRFRWAFGGIQILRKHWRALLPWAHSGLTQRQRRDYLLGGLWWFNDGLTLVFALFVGATALGVATGHPFVVQRLSGLGIALPLLYIALGLTRYLWGIRVATRVSVQEAFDAMRVNLSLSWVVTLACARALIEERGVFLRTPKFQGPALSRELRVVLVETLIAAAMFLLWCWSVAVAGVSLLTVTVLALTAWSVLIYGSATAFALGDPTRAPAQLRGKAALELGERVSRTMGDQQVRLGGLLAIGGALVLVAAAVLGESGRAPLGGGPFVGGGPAIGGLAPGPSSPAASQSGTPGQSQTSAASPGPLLTPAPPGTPRPSAAPSAAPTPTPAPTGTPVPSPSPPPPSPAAPSPSPASSAPPAG